MTNELENAVFVPREVQAQINEAAAARFPEWATVSHQGSAYRGFHQGWLECYRRQQLTAPAISLTDGGAGSQWVSVDDRLPEMEQKVLLLYGCKFGKNRQSVGHFEDNGIGQYFGCPENTWVTDCEPTHWQPLPTAPTSNGN